MSKRIPPHSTEAEMSVLGAMMLSDKAASTCARLLSLEKFYIPAHATIFEIAAELVQGGASPDMLALKTRLSASGQLQEVGDVEYLIQCAESVPSASNAPHYCGIVLENWRLRELEARCLAVIDGIHSQGKSAAEKLEPATRMLSGLDASHGRIVPLGEAAMDASDMSFRGIPTGFRCIDEAGHEGGATVGGVTYVAGGTGMGKTWVGIQIALHAFDNGVNVVFVSLEMEADRLGRRVMQMRTGSRTYSEAIDKGGEYAAAYGQELEALYQAQNFTIIEEADMVEPMSVERLAQELRALHMLKPIGLVVIDYAQLLVTKQPGQAWEKAGTVARSLKRMAGRLDCAIIALSQVSADEQGNPTLAASQEFGRSAEGIYALRKKKIKGDDGKVEREEEWLQCMKRRDGKMLSAKLAKDDWTQRRTEIMGDR